MNTNMREAFIRCKFQAAGDVSAMVVNALASGAGIQRKSRGWTANVCARTAKQLVKEGVFA